MSNHLEVTHRHRLRDNLTKDERTALRSLQNRSDIVIKPADKGSAVVVMSREDYVAEAHRQLGDIQYYHQLDKDPTEALSTEITELIEQMAERRSIDAPTKKFLTPLNPRPGRFYICFQRSTKQTTLGDPSYPPVMLHGKDLNVCGLPPPTPCGAAPLLPQRHHPLPDEGARTGHTTTWKSARDP